MKQASEAQIKEIFRDSEGRNRADIIVSQHLFKVATSFVDLQGKRHTADYDNSETWIRTAALIQVAHAKEGFQSWKAIRNEAAAQDYLFSLMLKKR